MLSKIKITYFFYDNIAKKSNSLDLFVFMAEALRLLWKEKLREKIKVPLK